MRFLTLDLIKKRLRIGNDFEDEVLELYGESAEKEALDYMQRSLESLYDEFGEVPHDIILACLSRVATSYKYQEEITDRNLSRLPYMWEAKLTKYIPPEKL
ncbi:MAG: head-tail connector protein [Prevotellaceae bacterium]|nr:head-tail connector protein [Prevotellaceae bacterium]